ncbi:MAG: hypothetical protein JST60_18465 [Chloroflexi bacterium SZAS-1]|nr:hypothetical protein [Chloroflexi bacterium SZAS-1]
MEGNGRKLAWIAIALSAVALLVSLGGRAQSSRAGFNGPMGFQQQGQQGRGMGRHGGWNGPQMQQGPQGPQMQQGPSGNFNGPQGMMGRGGPGRMGFFFLPFMLLGGLLKLVFVAGLIWLGFRLIRGRGSRPAGPAAWSTGAPSPAPRPGPEQPPYPDDTPQE